MNVILCHLPPPLLNQLAVVRPIIGQGSPRALRAVTPCHLTPITYLHHFANCPQYRFQWVGFWCREPWWHQLPWWKLPHCSPQLLVEAPPAAASSRCHRSAGWSCCFSTAVTPAALSRPHNGLWCTTYLHQRHNGALCFSFRYCAPPVYISKNVVIGTVRKSYWYLHRLVPDWHQK